MRILSVLLLTILLSVSFQAIAKTKTIKTKQAIQAIFKLFDTGRYDDAIAGLDKIQTKVVDQLKENKDVCV